ncbi:MAG: hypothetical protein ACKODS_05995, partial [Methylophilaceae bacterium]
MNNDSILLSCCVMHPEKVDLSKWTARIPKGTQIVSCVVKKVESYESQFVVIGKTNRLVSLQYLYTDYEIDFDFSAIRNFIDSEADGEWLLHIDSDEFIGSHPEEVLAEVRAMNETEAQAGWITISGIVHEPEDVTDIRERYCLHSCRLLRKSANIKWDGICHEVPNAEGKEVPMVDTDIVLIHDGYKIDKDSFQIKGVRNAKLLLREYQRKPTKRVWNYLIKTFRNLSLE